MITNVVSDKTDLEVGVLTDTPLARDETWTLTLILDRDKKESRRCVHATLHKMLFMNF